MITDLARNLLDQALIARIAVIDAKGYPHVIPIWYARDGDDVVFFSSRSARKIGFAQSNPKGAISIGGDPYGSEGYLLKGEFTIEEDIDHHWLKAITYRYEPKEQAEKDIADWGTGDLVVMRFKPAQVIKI